jgi:hypothetical protein
MLHGGEGGLVVVEFLNEIFGGFGGWGFGEFEFFALESGAFFLEGE